MERLHKSKAKVPEHPYSVPNGSNKKVKEVKKVVNLRASNDDLGEILTKSDGGSEKAVADAS